MKQYSRFIDYLIELNIILLIFAFPLNLGWFNKLWEALLIIWFLGKMMRREGLVMPPSGYLLFIFMGAVVVSSIFSKQIGISMSMIRYLTKGIALCIVSYDFASQDEKRIGRIAHYFIASALVVALYAIAEAALSKSTSFRAQSFFHNTFYLALWSGIGLLATIAKLLAKPTKISLFLYQISLVILGAAFILSKTRGPLLAVGIILFVVVFYVPNKLNLLKYFALLGVVSLLFFTNDETLRTRVLSILDDNTHLRWTIWKQSFSLIKENFWVPDWLFGRGPGLFKYEYIPFDHINNPFSFPHLMPLELVHASGLIGSLAFSAWFVFFSYKLNRLLKNKALDLRMKYIGLLPILVLLICLANESFFSRYFSFTFWIFVGISLALLRIERVALGEDGSNKVGSTVMLP